MGPRLVSRLSAVPLALCSLLAVAAPAFSQGWRGGAIFGEVTEGGDGTTFTLPQGVPFPQVTQPDRTFATDQTVSVVTGVEVDCLWAYGDIAPGKSDGTMRLTYLSLTDGDDPYVFIAGTYTVTIEEEGKPPYDVAGPVIGDQYSLYLPTVSDGGTPGDTSDDGVGIARASVWPDLAEGGRMVAPARFALGLMPRGAVHDTLVTSSTAAPHRFPVTLPGGAAFNQVTPADGSGDFPLPGATGATVGLGFVHEGVLEGGGIFPAPGALQTTFGFLVLDDGRGISFGRYRFTPDEGGPSEGLVIGDVSPPASGPIPPAGSVPVDGHVLSLANRTGRVQTLALGSYEGHFDGVALDTLTASTETTIYRTDSTPPEVAGVDADRLRRGSSQPLVVLFRDLNGHFDLTSAQVLVNGSRGRGRILARYTARTNTLHLFNRRVRRWVGPCRPGSGRTLKTPWARLDCRRSEVRRLGEYLVLQLQLRPSARMNGVWPVFGRVADRSRQVAGWRLVDMVDLSTPP